MSNTVEVEYIGPVEGEFGVNLASGEHVVRQPGQNLSVSEADAAALIEKEPELWRKVEPRNKPFSRKDVSEKGIADE